jgi:hypothetical protein
MMSIELGNQFELELWMNMSVTARELAVFSRLVFLFLFLFLFYFFGVKTHFGMQSSNHVTFFFFSFIIIIFLFGSKLILVCKVVIMLHISLFV